MLFLRGLRWRRGFAVAVLLVGTISAAAATLGPVYARAASESTLTDQLTSATYHSGLSFLAGANDHQSAAIDKARTTVAGNARVHGYGRPTASATTSMTADVPGAPHTTIGSLVTRDLVCQHVELLHGRCPTRLGEGMVDEDSAAADHWTVGRVLTLHQLISTPYGIGDGPVLAKVRIVGVYRPRDTEEAYWFGLPYFNARLGPAVAAAVQVGASPVFVPQSQFAHLPEGFDVEVDVGVLLHPSAIRLADVAALRKNVAAVKRRFPRTTPQPGPPQMRTDLDKVLDAAARDKHQVETATLVVVCELAALALLVLFQIVGRAVDARGDEIALAKLRGLSPRRTVGFALGESLVLLVLAAPIGSALGFGITELLAHNALVPGTPVVWTAPASLALAAAVAGCVTAAALGAVRTLVRPVLDQWRFTSSIRHTSRAAIALDVAVAVAAVVAVVMLRRAGEQPRAVFLLAPTLLVLAVALLGVRFLPRLAGVGLGPTRASRHVAAFLALRQTVRRPGGMRLAALLAVAVGLATFALSGEAVARANRAARSQTEVGTSVRLGVQYGVEHDPQTAVARADPHGKWAMATATWAAEGGAKGGPTITGPLLAVEPQRLKSTAFDVRGQLSPTQLADLITTPGAAPALFTGTRVRVTLTRVAQTGESPMIRIGVRPLHGLSAPHDTETLKPGRHTYEAAVDCRAGCAFTGVTLSRSFDANSPMTATVDIDGAESSAGAQWRPLRIEVRRSGAWLPGAVGVGATVRIATTGSAIRATVTSADNGSPVVEYAEAPARLPVVAAPKALSVPGYPTGSLLDYASNQADYRVRRFVAALPAVLDDGALVDLDYIRVRVLGFDRESEWSVWLGPHAPSDAVARLKRAGLIVQNRHTESQRRAVLSRQGPALGLLLLLACAIAAAVLAVGGTAVALLADGRRRSFELAALRVVGVRTRTLRRSAVAEQLLLLSAAVVLGLPSGYLAARLVLPAVPEFSDTTPVVLRYSPSLIVAGATAAALAVLLWVAAAIGGWALARAAVPSRLREAAR